MPDLLVALGLRWRVGMDVPFSEMFLPVATSEEIYRQFPCTIANDAYQYENRFMMVTSGRWKLHGIDMFA